MEVHHHSHHPKKWKEYITEFLMLFLAVSLGFMAENIREHQIEKQREIAYLQNVHKDLKLDLANIDSVMYQNVVRLNALDTFFSSMKKGTLTNEDVYYYSRNLGLRSTFESSHVGLDQIKSAGGLRMVKVDEIVSGIQEYERMLNSIDKLESVRERSLEQARFKMATVFDPLINYEMLTNQGQGTMRFNRPEKADGILMKNQEDKNELFNLLALGLNTNRYLNNRLTALKSIGEKLDKAILKEYESKFVASH